MTQYTHESVGTFIDTYALDAGTVIDSEIEMRNTRCCTAVRCRPCAITECTVAPCESRMPSPLSLSLRAAVSTLGVAVVNGEAEVRRDSHRVDWLR